MLMYSSFLHEPQLIAIRLRPRAGATCAEPPQFLDSMVPIPDAGLCTGKHQPKGKAHLPHGRIF